jgi:hypothetical protein
MQSGRWIRHEVFGDRVNLLWDSWTRYRCNVGSASGLGGQFEFRPPGSTLYVVNNNSPGWTVSTWTRIVIGALGFDGQSGDVHAGQEIDIANIYVDSNQERIEISTATTLSEWQAGLAANVDSDGTPRELQGRWNLDSSTQLTFRLNHGQFASLDGLRAWYVTGSKTAELIGRWVAA